MSPLPCTSRTELFDLVLFADDVPDAQRATARGVAAGLCAACPQPCGERVTATTQPRSLALLPEDYLPPAVEGRPEPKVPEFGGRRSRAPQMAVGWDYVRPHQRVAAWSRMAGEMAAAGRSTAEIALALAVSEDTVALLVEASGVGSERAA